MTRRLSHPARWLLALALALALCPWRGPAPAAAATCVVTNANDAAIGPAGSLRAALDDANCAAITFDLPAPGPWIIHLAATLLIANHDVTVTGPGRDLLTLDGGGALVPLSLSSVTATLEGLTVAHGRTTSGSGGGGRIVGGTVTLRHARVSDNQAVGTATGGGLYIGGGTVTLDDVEVLRNTAGIDANSIGGGGIFADQTVASTALTIRNSTIADNTATGRGAGLFAVRWGGQIAANTHTVNIENSTVARNHGASGGGIYSWQASLTVAGSRIADNVSGTAGVDDQNYTGGGIHLNGSPTTISASTISGNFAGGAGGGLYAYASSPTIAGSTFAGNAAHSGAALYGKSGNSIITNSTFTGNTATSDGGAVGLFEATATLTGTTVARNQAGTSGGAFFPVGTGNALSSITLRQSIVVGNAPVDCSIGQSLTASITSAGDNIVSQAGGCPADHPGDFTYRNPLSDLIAPALADNGGPTQTIDLTAEGLAIDRVPADRCTLATDQRGVARPQGVACDIGAVEATVALVVQVSGGGTVQLDPPGVATRGGTYTFGKNTGVKFTPLPDPGQVFIGWNIDGAAAGWFAPATYSLFTSRTVQAVFVPAVTFPDVPGGRADTVAIEQLAARGAIRGYASGKYGPDDGVSRAQMAALIARATTSTSPAGHTLTPPACLVAGSWDCEDWGNTFQDRSGLDGNLWRDVGVLQHYGVANGLDGVHFGPNAPVTYAQTISFITRAMIAKGYWSAQPDAPLPYAGVPAAHATDVRTFAYYTQGGGGVPAPPGDWNAGASRGWFARALWAALDATWGNTQIL